MLTSPTMTPTEARREFFSLVESISSGESDPVTVLSKNGEVVIISKEWLEGLLETLYIQQAVPDIEERIAKTKTTKGRKDYARASDLGY